MNNRNALHQYQTINNESSLEGANRHRLIQMLLTGAISRLTEAKGQFQRGDVAAFGESLGKSISIITGLQSSLDLKKGGDIANNLDGLYDYMVRTLLKVHAEKSEQPMAEVLGLLVEIKAGWDGIEPEVSH